MLRVAVVGCGKIADAHVAQIQRVPGCAVVGVCDREILMARQLADRFGIARHYSDVGALLEHARPDVVHIATPPQTHFALAVRCLEAGCHVYVEKPITVHAREAEHLVALANRVGRRLTVGHDDQFRHTARRLRAMVEAGYLGGPPVHLESHYGYEFGDTGAYAKALLSDERHWVRGLPGQLLHNVISHGIARIAEFLVGRSLRISAHGFVSPMLQRLGERTLIDELRVVILDDHGATAYFTLSSQMRPSLHQFRVYGPRNGLLLDQDTETLVRLPGRRYKSYAEHFLSPVGLAAQYVGNVSGNVRRFLANDFHAKAGLKYLIAAFYRSITEGTPLPIPYPEMLLTSHILDEIFAQLPTRPVSSATEAPPVATVDARPS